LRGFIDEEVKVLSNAEKAARNAKIIAVASYVKAKDKYDIFSSTGGSVELKLFRLEKVRINQSFRDRNLSVENRNTLLLEREELDDAIALLMEEQKWLKEDAASINIIHLSAARAYKEVQVKKSKSDTPIVATVENVLLGHNILPARYHGGKLNGVGCRALMSKAKSIIPEIEAVLHVIEHPHRCSSQTIEQRCKIYHDILVALDFIASKIRIKQGQLKDADLHELRRSIASLDYLWTLAGLSSTPKIHGVLAHASDQVGLIGGIGDLLEDDLEHLHQMSQKISYRTGRIKNAVQQALFHSKMEAKINNKEIIDKTMELQQQSKRVFKKA
jgi:hypothetical protein